MCINFTTENEYIYIYTTKKKELYNQNARLNEREIIKKNDGGTLHTSAHRDVLSSDPKSKLAQHFDEDCPFSIIRC